MKHALRFTANNRSTPAQARKNLQVLTQDMFANLIWEFRMVVDYAYPDNNGDHTAAVGSFKDVVREERKADFFGPNAYNAGDSEEENTRKDFIFIKDFIIGPHNTHPQKGVIENCLNQDETYRHKLLSENTEWYNGIVPHIAKVYKIETLAKQLQTLAELHNIINSSNKDDAAVINEYKAVMNNARDLTKPSFEQDAFSKFFTKAYDIISCVIFPIAGLRAINSYLYRGTFNFFKPDGQTFAEAANQSIDAIEEEKLSIVVSTP